MIFGYERLQEDGDPIENCLDFVSNNWNICDCHNYFCGMFQKVKHITKEEVNFGDEIFPWVQLEGITVS